MSYQGVLGAVLIKLNVRVALYRNNSPLRNMRVFEVLVVTAITAIISWPVCGYLDFSPNRLLTVECYQVVFMR